MLLRGHKHRLAQRDRLQIVTPADLWLCAVLDGAQKLRHRADESVGKPHFLPARRQPIAGLLVRGEIEGARRFGRIARPADCAARQSVGSFDAPADIDVALGTLTGRAGPDVVPTRSPAA